MAPAEAKLNQNIRHYCRKIERHPNEREPLLRALEVLGSLKGISIAALSETGVGKTVKGLKRHEDGEVAARAKALIAKWKELVAKEDEKEDEGETENPVSAQPKPTDSMGELDQNGKEEKRKRHKMEEEGKKRSRHDKSRHSDESKSSSKRHKSSKKDSSSSTSYSSSSSSRQHHKTSKRPDLKDDGAFENALNGLAETLSAPKKESKRSKGSSSNRSLSREKNGDSNNLNSLNSHNNLNSLNSVNSRKNKPDGEPSSLSSASSVPLNLCTEYKPLRQPQAVRTEPVRLGMTDDGALSELLAMRKSGAGRRSAVYSGAKRTGYFGSVPSLQEICIHVLQENVDSIAECGGLPYSLLKPILERASPATLMEIEECNPDLMEDTGELWERFVRKSFPRSGREEMETWREVYERCTMEREQKMDKLMNKVKDKYTNLDQSKKKTKLAYVDAVAKPPRGVRRAQERNGIFAQVGAPHKKGSERTKAVAVREHMSSGKKPKVAPMMAKTLKMMKGFKTGFRR